MGLVIGPRNGEWRYQVLLYCDPGSLGDQGLVMGFGVRSRDPWVGTPSNLALHDPVSLADQGIVWGFR
jgi:hypothetical protein